MSINIIKRSISTSLGSATTSGTIFTANISNYKSYTVTIRCSSSTGFVYNLKTAPINYASMFSSQTGGTFSPGACATITHDVVTNNNQNWLIVTGSATATVSGSNVDIILTAIERSM
jgi:hypothetical protein